MASPTLPALLLAFLFLAAAAAPGAGGAFDAHVDGDGRFLLLDCGDGSSGAAPAKNSSANVADLLAALPSAAAPEGAAVLSRGGASVRGVCIGNDSSPEDCRSCLAAAAGNITGGGCGGPTGRRGGAWSDGCFLAYYADAAAARGDGDDDRRKVMCDADIPRSYLDDGDRGSRFMNSYYYWTFPDPTFFWLLVDLAQRAADEPARALTAGERRSDYNPGMTVRALAQCTGDDRADCLRCLTGSACQAVLSCGGAGSGWLRGGRVLSYGCYMRFEVSYRCGNPVQPASAGSDCSSAPAHASGTAAAALLRWLAGGLIAAVLLHGPRGM